MIASSPTDLQPVLQTILEDAAELCDAHYEGIFKFDGQVFRYTAGRIFQRSFTRQWKGTHYVLVEKARSGVFVRNQNLFTFQMFLTTPNTYSPSRIRKKAFRSVLAVPLLKETTLIGALVIHRREVRPFTDAQIKLLDTFADQAVIAIENVRLFKELKEALEQQTATSGTSGVIASSPTDIQRVLNTACRQSCRPTMRGG